MDVRVLLVLAFLGAAFGTSDLHHHYYYERQHSSLPTCPPDIFCGVKCKTGGCDGRGGTKDACGLCGGDGSTCSSSSSSSSSSDDGNSSCDEGCQAALIVGCIVLFLVILTVFVWFVVGISSRRSVLLVQSKYRTGDRVVGDPQPYNRQQQLRWRSQTGRKRLY